MAGAAPEEKVRLVVHRQRWSRVAFLHWRYDPDELLAHLPAGVRPELIDGSAWVTLTPLVIEAARAPGLPAILLLSHFAETNVRTYVRTETGEDALVFLSLDAASPLPLGARLGLGLPYLWSDVSVRVASHRFGERVTYRCRRVGGSAGHDITLDVGDLLPAAERRPLDDELTGRWRAFVRVAGVPAVLPVCHPPWTLRRVDSVTYTESLLAAAGLSAPIAEPLVHYADGVTVAFGPPRPLALAHRRRREATG